MIGSHLRRIRLQRGMTQRALAAALDVHPQWLSAIENDRVTPSFTTIRRVADALNCDAAVTLTPRDHAH